jgi:hypothetical protein
MTGPSLPVLRPSPLLGALVVIAVLYLPGLLAPGIYHPPQPKLNDGTLQFVPWHTYYREELLAGRLPLWNPYLFGGTPFAAEPLSAVFYPGSLIFLLPISLEFAFKLHLVLHLLVGAFFMGRLCRSLGASRAGAAVGALAFGLNTQFVQFVFAGWSSCVAVAAWAPAVLWSFVEALASPEAARRVRYASAGALFFALQLLAGHPEWAYYTALIFGVAAVAAAAVGDGIRVAWRPVATAAYVLLGGAVLAGVQLLPTLEATWLSSRGQSALAGATQAAGAGLSPLLLPTLLMPRLYGPWDLQLSVDSWLHRVLALKVSWGETIAYVGVIPLALAALGWRARTRGVAGPVWLALGTLGLAFAMNDLTHLKSLVDRLIPAQGVFRSPARFVFVVYFSLSVLASLGMTRLERGEFLLGPRAARMLALAAALLAVGGLALAAAPRATAGWTLAEFPALDRLRPLLAARAVSIEDAAILAVHHTGVQLLVASAWLGAATALLAGARRLPPPRLGWIVLVLSATDLSTVAAPFVYSLASPGRIYAADLDKLRSVASRTTRLTVEGDRTFAGGRNVPLLARVRSFDGYDVFLLAHYTRIVGTLGGPDRERRLGALAVNARVVTDQAERQRRAAWTIEPVSPAAPYAYWTDRVIVVSSEEEALEKLPTILDVHPPAVLVVRERDNVGRGTVQAREQPPPSGRKADVRVLQDQPGRLHLRVRSETAGWLVVNEVWYPGWRATVDGTQTPIHRVNAGMRAIELPAGTHDVEFRYAPGSFRVGLVLSTAGFVLVVGGALRRARGNCPAA